MDTQALEARVKARLDDERREMDGRIAATEKDRDDAVREYNQAKAKADDAAGKVMDAVAAGKPLTDAQRTKATDTLKAVGKALSRVMVQHAAAAELGSERKALDAKGELDRRIKQAKEFVPDGDKDTLTGREAAEMVLMRAGRPMHYREITRVALETGLLRTEGETPEATISALLATRAKKGDTFRKVEPGIFDLLPVAAEAGAAA